MPSESESSFQDTDIPSKEPPSNLERLQERDNKVLSTVRQIAEGMNTSIRQIQSDLQIIGKEQSYWMTNAQHRFYSINVGSLTQSMDELSALKNRVSQDQIPKRVILSEYIHNIRNAINPLKLANSLLQQQVNDLVPADKIRETFEIVLVSLTAVEQQTEKLVQALTGNELVIEQVNLQFFLSKLKTSLLSTATTGRLLEIGFDISEKLPESWSFDPVLISSCIAELVENARKYSERGSRVTIKVSIGEDQIGIGVKDRGLPIPKEELSKIFIRGQRSSLVTQATNIPGTGTGLSHVNRIVRLHGGKVGVRQRSIVGSPFKEKTFAIVLPARKTRNAKTITDERV